MPVTQVAGIFFSEEAMVIAKLQEAIREAGTNYLLCVLSFGSLAPKAALRSLELFSREVMPGL